MGGRAESAVLGKPAKGNATCRQQHTYIAYDSISSVSAIIDVLIGLGVVLISYSWIISV